MCYENGNLEVLWDVKEPLMDLGALQTHWRATHHSPYGSLGKQIYTQCGFQKYLSNPASWSQYDLEARTLQALCITL